MSDDDDDEDERAVSDVTVGLISDLVICSILGFGLVWFFFFFFLFFLIIFYLRVFLIQIKYKKF